LLKLISNIYRLSILKRSLTFRLTVYTAVETNGVKTMERAIDSILISAMVGIAFLANYSYLMS